MISICIASGASLTKEDVDYCRGKGKIYLVNDNYKIAPWGDTLYAADGDWWDYHKGVNGFKGERWTCNKAASLKYNINHISIRPKELWSNEPDWIATGGNSGFQIVNLAELQGASKIILLGYDMGYTDKKHWFGEHPSCINRASDYKKWVEKFERAKPFIRSEVINCTPKSNLNCFPMMDLRECL